MITSLGSMVLYHVFLLMSHVLLLGTSCDAKKNYSCAASSCGEIRNISYPFRLKGDRIDCGKYELVCEDNRTILYLYPGRYYVKSINYSYYHSEDYLEGTIKVVDDGLQKGNCSSLPRYSLARSNFSSNPYYPLVYSSVVFMKCSQSVASTSYIDTKPCNEEAHVADTPPNLSQMAYAYAGQQNDYPRVGDIKDSCTITMNMMASKSEVSRWEGNKYNGSSPYKDLHNVMTEGFDLSYTIYSSSSPTWFLFCFLGFRYGGKRCLYYQSVWGITVNFALNTTANILFVFAHFIAAKFVLGAPFVLIFLIYKGMRRHQAMDANIEEFLQAHNNFLPIRYSYSNIKKITKNFKHKLGEGGYGSVYRGTLRSGNEIAVKILNKPKSNGQDFISEVATIGRIHHVNVVQLVGYCFDDSQQALMYDFMPNGSLDKHIFSGGDARFLDYKKIYEISLGVARGIEYLHRGCDMQILHFDIKPHNILLDQNFTPKVSDFGLARLYPTNHNTVQLTAARGTLGYMAPELFYQDIGGVSHKADVYSFGMLLMEMAGRRRNVNANIEHSSQTYFPLWIYDQLSKEYGVEMEEVEGEREITRKMVIVALWCIQLMPNDRPSMNRVIDMLEGNIDKLRLPPKPLLYPSEKPVDEVSIEIELESFSTSSSAATTYDGHRFRNNNEITESCFV